MNLGLDTSVVLRLLVGEPEPMAEAARRRLAEALSAGDRTVISDLVLLEAYHALQFHYEIPRNRARDLIHAMFASGTVHPEHPESARAFLPAPGTGPADRLIHAHYALLGARTLTFDAALARLPGAEKVRTARRSS